MRCQRLLFVRFEVRLPGDGVCERPVLPLSIAIAFAALKPGERPGFALLATGNAIPGLALGIAGFGSHR
jgi:hypothetical protein